MGILQIERNNGSEQRDGNMSFLYKYYVIKRSGVCLQQEGQTDEEFYKAIEQIRPSVIQNIIAKSGIEIIPIADFSMIEHQLISDELDPENKADLVSAFEEYVGNGNNSIEIADHEAPALIENQAEPLRRQMGQRVVENGNDWVDSLQQQLAQAHVDKNEFATIVMIQRVIEGEIRNTNPNYDNLPIEEKKQLLNDYVALLAETRVRVEKINTDVAKENTRQRLLQAIGNASQNFITGGLADRDVRKALRLLLDTLVLQMAADNLSNLSEEGLSNVTKGLRTITDAAVERGSVGARVRHQERMHHIEEQQERARNANAERASQNMEKERHVASVLGMINATLEDLGLRGIGLTHNALNTVLDNVFKYALSIGGGGTVGVPVALALSSWLGPNWWISGIPVSLLVGGVIKKFVENRLINDKEDKEDE